MTELPFRYHPAALSEFRSAALESERERPGQGARLTTAVERVIARVCRAPRSAPAWSPDKAHAAFRCAVVAGVPFVVVYEVVAQQLVVLAVAHTRRSPGYWLDRPDIKK